MNSMVNQAKTLAMEDPIKNRTDATTKMRMFVKVTMDGIPIGRKIDLNAHRCYESLSNTLEDMFLKPKTDGNLETRLKILPDGSSGLVLTYEDKEGDWMLVGDVPWRMFIGSVKRHWSHLHSCVEVKEWSIGVTCLSCTPLYSHIIMSRTGADLALPPRICPPLNQLLFGKHSQGNEHISFLISTDKKDQMHLLRLLFNTLYYWEVAVRSYGH